MPLFFNFDTKERGNAFVSVVKERFWLDGEVVVNDDKETNKEDPFWVCVERPSCNYKPTKKQWKRDLKIEHAVIKLAEKEFGGEFTNT